MLSALRGIGSGTLVLLLLRLLQPLAQREAARDAVPRRVADDALEVVLQVGVASVDVAKEQERFERGVPLLMRHQASLIQ